MALTGKKIDDGIVVGALNGSEKIPIGNGTNSEVVTQVSHILDYVKNDAIIGGKADKNEVLEERIRATTAEGMLAQQINSEKQRAQAAEDMLAVSVAHTEQLTSGIVKIDAIYDAGYFINSDGVYLQYSSAGGIAIANGNLDNVVTVKDGRRTTTKCSKGRLYLVGFDYYRFDGVTCHLIGEGGGDVSCGDVITDITTIL